MSLTVLLTATLLAVSEPPVDKNEDADRVETGVIAETVAIEAEPVIADTPVDDQKSGEVVQPEGKPESDPAETPED